MKKITKPIISEKSFLLASAGKYTFATNKDYSKEQIKSAVENLYKVSVEKVNVLNLKGKKKVARGVQGKRSDTKKFILTLKKGQKIDLFDTEEKAKQPSEKTENVETKIRKKESKDNIVSKLRSKKSENNPTALSMRGGDK